VQDLVGQVKGRAVDALNGLPLVGDDPHVWLDPVFMQQIADSVKGALVQGDGKNRSTYEANARRLRSDLAKLDREFTDGLHACDRNIVVTSHAAYLYVTSRYGLEQEAITGATPEAEPSPARLAELTKLVRDAGVTTIFTEPLVTAGAAATLARETGAKTAVLDPIEGPPKNAPTTTYFQLMRRDLATLRSALGCH
jgi:zinc transport system substrate-binding protein